MYRLGLGVGLSIWGHIAINSLLSLPGACSVAVAVTAGGTTPGAAFPEANRARIVRYGTDLVSMRSAM